MAVLAITELQLTASTSWELVTIGEVAALGSVMYADGSGIWYKASATGTAEQAGALDLGLLLQATDEAGQSAIVLTGGDIYVTSSGGVAEGTTYVLGATAGSVHEHSDLTTGWKNTRVGVGGGAGLGTTDAFRLMFLASGVEK